MAGKRISSWRSNSEGTPVEKAKPIWTQERRIAAILLAIFLGGIALIAPVGFLLPSLRPITAPFASQMITPTDQTDVPASGQHSSFLQPASGKQAISVPIMLDEVTIRLEDCVGLRIDLCTVRSDSDDPRKTVSESVIENIRMLGVRRRKAAEMRDELILEVTDAEAAKVKAVSEHSVLFPLLRRPGD